MQSAIMPENEDERLADLRSYAILDTAPEEQFDALTELAASILNTPIALVSLIDEERQWFKSHHGLEVTETPREFAFCSHAILQGDVFEIYDSRKDERFFDNPLVVEDPEVIFYAGAPLITPEGNKLGTLCVIDHKPHDFSAQNKRQLEIIAKQVMAQLQLRKHLIHQSEGLSELLLLTEEVNTKNKELARINKELKSFTAAASHDLKAPLIGIDQLASWVAEDIENGQFDDVPENLKLIRQRVQRLNSLLDDLLAYARVGQGKAPVEEVDTDALARELFTLSAPEDFELTVDVRLPLLMSHKAPFEQIMNNLITNAFKHHHLDRGHIHIGCEERENDYQFSIRDDGPGIEQRYHEHVFDMFKTLKSRDQVEGSGMGLSMVKKIVENYGGEVTVKSALNEGAVFYFSWPKSV